MVSVAGLSVEAKAGSLLCLDNIFCGPYVKPPVRSAHRLSPDAWPLDADPADRHLYRWAFVPERRHLASATKSSGLADLSARPQRFRAGFLVWLFEIL